MTKPQPSKKYLQKKIHRMIKRAIVLCNLIDEKEVRRYLIDAEMILREKRWG